MGFVHYGGAFQVTYNYGTSSVYSLEISTSQQPTAGEIAFFVHFMYYFQCDFGMAHSGSEQFGVA